MQSSRLSQFVQVKAIKSVTSVVLLTVSANVLAEDSLEQQIRQTEALIEKKQHDLGLDRIDTENVDVSSESVDLDGSENDSNLDDYTDNKQQDNSAIKQDEDTTFAKMREQSTDEITINQKDATETEENQTNVAPNLQDISPEDNQNDTVEEPPIEKPKPRPKTPEQLLAKVAPPYDFSTDAPTEFMQKVNNAKWYKGMKINPHTTLRIQVLLDWNHSSPGPIDTGWGMNSRKAIRAFEKKHGLKVDGKMDSEVWQLLNQGKNSTLPALVRYTITKEDVRTRFKKTPKGYEAKSKDWELSYNNIYEMFGERFHMSQGLLKQINKGIKFRQGKTITVVNVGRHNKRPVDSVVVDKRRNILYAYDGDTVVATYPTTIGNRTPKSGKTYRMVGKVYMPTYKAQTEDKRYILPPGPNNPVGVAWMALSKPTFGIHGSPKPEGISRQRSHGCVRLTNWDAAELYATIKKGAKVRFK